MNTHETDHEQVKIEVDPNDPDMFILVDKPLEKIIQRLFDYRIVTSLSCWSDINDNTNITFPHFIFLDRLMELIFKEYLKIEDKSYGAGLYKNTLFYFMTEHVTIKTIFIPELKYNTEKQDHIETGKLDHLIKIEFNKTLLPIFEEFLLTTLPEIK